MVPVAYSVNYYAALEKTMGANTLDSFIRFYLFPGVYHCGGGQGPFTRDLLTPLTYWVEQGIAPGALIAAHIPQNPQNFGPGSMQEAAHAPTADMTRPVYPYPFTARYIGSGDINDARNFVQGAPMKIPADIYKWFGTSLYTPGYEKVCTGKGTTFDCSTSR
jgi:feruloyl esterase